VEAAEAATPKLAKLARFVDVFCERGIFEIEQSRRVLEAGKRAGLTVKVHADEMCLLGGAKLAAELGAISADHLLFTDDETIAAMKRAGTIAVLLPGTPFVLRIAYAQARRFIDAGVPVAIGSDLNPNCYCESLPFAFALSVYEMKMTPAEALTAVTINAAAAIGLEKKIGSLTPGKLADIVILKGPSYLHLGYHVGGNPVKTVIKRGRIVAEN
ncbi:MAG TPA: amidohydrolase family protein, partial [Planctomycetota bacterium]|nr:amidohydrolase family protein [Planctomycetota bacterium]